MAHELARVESGSELEPVAVVNDRYNRKSFCQDQELAMEDQDQRAGKITSYMELFSAI